MTAKTSQTLRNDAGERRVQLMETSLHISYEKWFVQQRKTLQLTEECNKASVVFMPSNKCNRPTPVKWFPSA